MKYTIALPLVFAALGLAASTAQEKRATGQVTLYRAVNYGGESTSLTIDTGDNGKCTELPSSFNNQVLSIRLNPSGSTFYCRLLDASGCATSNPENDTWFFDASVPNLSQDPYTIGSKATSIWCGHRA